MEIEDMDLRAMLKQIMLIDPDYFDDILALNSPVDLATVVKKDFQVPQHIRVINDYLMKLYDHDIDRLAIFAPPRHSKSMTTSFFLAWALIQNPDEQVIYSSYSADLAVKQSQDVRSIVENVGPLFGVYTDPTSRAKDFWRIKDTEGYFRAVGVGGGISGMGATIACLDDPMKNMEEALSPTTQQKTHDWFTSTFLTRLSPKGRVVLIQTIWSVNDIGYEIQQDKDTKWTVLNFPAIATEDDHILNRSIGDALWPSYWDIDKLTSKKEELGEWVFSALYQQSPTSRGGNLLREDWLQYYDPRNIRFSEGLYHHYMGVDPAATAKKTSDYTCTCTISVHDQTGDIYIRDWTREHITPLEQEKHIVDKYKYYSHHMVGIESTAYQAALPEMILKSTPMPIKQVKPTTNKELRIQSQFTLFENGKVYIPNDHPLLGEFEGEYVQFPNGKHDDLLDATEIALSMASTGMYMGTVGEQEYKYGQNNIQQLRGTTRNDDRSEPRFKQRRRR